MKKIEFSDAELRILLDLVREEQLGLESSNPFEACVTNPAEKDKTVPMLVSMRRRLYEAAMYQH